MPIRKVTLIDDKVTVNPCDMDLEKLQISLYARLYVGLTGDDLYLLHGVTVNKKCEYRWLALWNVVTWTSIGGFYSWNSIEDALKAALDNGWSIRQLNNDYFKYLIEDMKRDVEIP